MPPDREPFEVDPSHALDLVTLFSSSNHDAETEAYAIHGVLEANGIVSLVVGAAQRVLAEAKEAGPAAAVEAERGTEDAG
jgi:hypothetical protein